VFALKHNNSAARDGFLEEFYQGFWEEIKDYLKKMLDSFHKGDLESERLNHGVISLITKVSDAITI
jgi:hypothetical protein